LEWENYKRRNRDINIKSPGAWGHLKSFISILEHAKQNKYNRILFLEDDVLFHKNFNALFQSLELPSAWKLLYLGANDHGFRSRKITQPCLYKCDNKVYGTFAFGIDSSVFDLLQSVANKFQSPSDGDPVVTVMDKYPDQCKVIYPNLIIADVSTSTIRNNANMMELAYKVGWNLPMYNY
jgi:GR25 family glycosyltransferase involved in LPS biosynthesis